MRFERRAAKYNIGNMFLFELLSRLVFLPVIISLARFATRIALRAARYSYVTEEDILRFLMKPATIALYAVLGIFLLGIACFESAVLAEGAAASEAGIRLPLPAMIARGVSGFFHRKKLAARALSAAVIFVLPNLFLVARVVRHVAVFASALAWIKRTPLAVAGVLGVLLLLGIALLPAIRCFLSAYRPGRRGGWRMLARSGLFTFLWNVAGYAGYLATFLIAEFLMCLGVLALAGTSSALSMALVLSGVIDIALVFAWSIFCIPMMFLAAIRVSGRRLSGDAVAPDIPGLRRQKRAFWAILAAALLISGTLAGDIARNGPGYTPLGELEITAHRGSSGAPENTIESIYAAADAMADRVELDVRMSADGELVLLHDPTLKRTAGVSGYVWNWTAEGLSALDVGSYMGGEYAGSRIPTLRQALESAKGRINVNLDVKFHAGDENMIGKVIALIREFDMEEQCVISSTYAPYLRMVKEEDPAIHTGLILSTAIGEYYALDYVDFYSVNSDFLSYDTVRRIRQEGKAVCAWTVNSIREISRMKRIGVDNIITDDPAVCRERLGGDSSTKSILELLRMAIR